MLLTYIHEFGHDIHLKISSILLKQKYHKSKIDIYKSSFFIFYLGYTHNALYKYFKDNKMYNYIRFNAISGTLFVIFIFTSISICLDFIMPKYHLIFTIPNILLETSNFFTSSDFKYFMKPEEFKYHE